MLDNYNRKIDYLRISVTDRCNLRCIYCMPEEGVFLKTHNEIISYEKILNVVQVATSFGIRKVRLTGGEPLVRRNISFFIKEIKRVNGIEELTLTTNGVLLGKMALELKEAGLDRINISLDTLDPKKYRQITRIGEIDEVLRGIEAIKNVGFKGTKINMVVVPGINETEMEKMRAFCKKNGLTLQRINHYSLRDFKSINRNYDAERPLPCDLCNRVRLTADGKLKPCLFSDMEIPVNFGNIGESLKKAILNKPESGTFCTLKQNWQIGG